MKRALLISSIVIILIILGVSVFLIMNNRGGGGIIVKEPVNVKMGTAFPPFKADQRERTLGALKDLNIDRIRLSLAWDSVEQEEGERNWKWWDTRMDFINENNLKIMVTAESRGPDWECTEVKNKESCVFKDPEAFEEFIDEFLTRYKNKIYMIQFGNEWNSDYWYAGTAEDYVLFQNILYDSVKSITPSTKVALGAITSEASRKISYCRDSITEYHEFDGKKFSVTKVNEKERDDYCNSEAVENGWKRMSHVFENAKYDLFDMHLYDIPEDWQAAYDAVDKLTDKPIICSEFGGPNFYKEPYSEEYQAERLVKYLEAVNSIGLEEAYYYKLVDCPRTDEDSCFHENSGLIKSPSLEKKPAYHVFKEFMN